MLRHYRDHILRELFEVQSFVVRACAKGVRLINQLLKLHVRQRRHHVKEWRQLLAHSCHYLFVLFRRAESGDQKSATWAKMMLLWNEGRGRRIDPPDDDVQIGR